LGKLPRDIRFKEWHSQIRAYETPYKKLSDLGRGLIAAVAGVSMAGGLLMLYRSRSWARRVWAVFGLWLALWALRIPFSMWYYGVRQDRFEYPTWGDAIIIPVINETLVWMIGAVISSVVLGILLIGHQLPKRIRFIRPASPLGWLRAAILALWLVALLVCGITGVIEGNEGMTFSCLGASAILVIFLSSTKAPPLEEHGPDIDPLMPSTATELTDSAGSTPHPG
jgi:hypothetical protein